MRLLLDTHAALWWAAADPRLGANAKRHLDDASNEVVLSAAVVWEVGIKHALSRLDASPQILVAGLVAGGARPLPIGLDHALAASELPWHHRDPFDRMLVAQAAHEGAAIVTKDPLLEMYGVPLIW